MINTGLEKEARQAMARTRSAMAGEEAGWRMACVLLMSALRRGESLDDAINAIKTAPQAAAHVARDVEVDNTYAQHLSTKERLELVRLGYRQVLGRVVALHEAIQEDQNEQGTGSSEKG